MTSEFFPTPHSCDFCRKLVLYLRDEKWWEKALTSDVNDPEHIGPALSDRIKTWLIEQLQGSSDQVKRHRFLQSLGDLAIFDCTVAEAKDAATKGCNFCKAIMGDLSQVRIEKGDANFVAVQDVSRRPCFGVVYSGLGKESPFTFIQRNRNSFEIVALPDSEAATDVSTRPINTRPGSDRSLSMAQTWLQTCLETHHACPKPNLSFMPTRLMELLYVRGVRCLRLTEAKSSEPYAALSYCWGGEQSVKTTIGTILRHLNCINMTDLPATVRDAIKVMETLGIMKIWIDAFCIVQDDPIDKAREIAQMPLVYSQATVTIVASRAREVDEGFLHDRPRMGHESPDLVFEIPFHCSNNKAGSVVLLPILRQTTEPLDCRAWALQERFLSPRILEFGSVQTRWICQASSGFRSPTDGYTNRTVDNQERKDSLFTLGLQAVLGFGNQDPRASTTKNDLRRYWYDLVNVYTHRTLTFGTDRLPAISGIAAQFGKVLGDEYKAGMWGSQLETELLWRIDSPPETLCLRSQEHQGPSWSWAALNVPVSLPTFIQAVKKESFDIEIMGCHTKACTASTSFSLHDTSFGSVEAGSIKLRGRLEPAEWIHYEEFSGTFLHYTNTLRNTQVNGPDGTLPGTIYPDAIELEFAQGNPCSISVYLLKICKTADWNIQGLVLRQRADSTFSRLGVFLLHESWSDESTRSWTDAEKTSLYKKCEDWLSSEPQTITIV